MYSSTIAIACVHVHTYYMQDHDIRASSISRSIAQRGAAQPRFSENTAIPSQACTGIDNNEYSYQLEYLVM